MGKSSYVKNLRKRVGSDVLLMPCAAAVIRKDGGILLQRRADDDKWALPGGAIDPAEAPAQALAREVREETGLIVRPTRLLGVVGGYPKFRHTYPNGDRVDAVVAVFSCEVVAGTLNPDNDETEELRYFGMDDVLKLVPQYPAHVYAAERQDAFFEWRDEWVQRPG